MSVLKKVFTLGAIAMTICAFSDIKTTKKTYVAENIGQSLFDNNIQFCSKDK
ncbi:hypothetical protein H1Q59_07555 [Holosporaceae bacterium 'Namur']|nr:hypothetical protein [Holosporaceae bacterium 'Namur']